jgi:hypothetical protein
VSGTPSPEVTGLICRIPSLEFSPTRLGLLTQGHLCQFSVRAADAVLDFSRAIRIGRSLLAETRSLLPPVLTMTVLPGATKERWTGICPLPLAAGFLEDALTCGSQNINCVSFREFRLRTHLGSTNPRRMIVVVEPWPLRRTGFSPVFAATPPRIFDGTRSIGAHAPTSTRAPRLLTRWPLPRPARISGTGLTPSIFGAHALDW